MALPDKNISANVVWYYGVCGEDAEAISYRLQIDLQDVVDALKTFKLYNSGIQSNPLIACGAYKRIGLQNGVIHDVVWDDVADYIEANYTAPIKESLEGYLNRVYCHKLVSPRLIIPAAAVLIALVLIFAIVTIVKQFSKPSPTPPPVTTITDPTTDVTEPSTDEPTQPEVQVVRQPDIQLDFNETLSTPEDTQDSESLPELLYYKSADKIYIGYTKNGKPAGYNVILSESGYTIENIGYDAGNTEGIKVDHHYTAPYTVTTIGAINNYGELNGLGIFKINDKTIVGEYRDGSFISGSKVYICNQDPTGAVEDGIAELSATFYPSNKDFKSYVMTANKVAEGWVKAQGSGTVTSQGKFKLTDESVTFDDSSIFLSLNKVDITGKDLSYYYTEEECTVKEVYPSGESISITYTPSQVIISAITLADYNMVEQRYIANISNVSYEVIEETPDENTESTDINENTGDTDNTEDIKDTETTKGDTPTENQESNTENNKNSDEPSNNEEELGDDWMIDPLTGKKIPKSENVWH